DLAGAKRTLLELHLDEFDQFIERKARQVRRGASGHPVCVRRFRHRDRVTSGFPTAQGRSSKIGRSAQRERISPRLFFVPWRARRGWTPAGCEETRRAPPPFRPGAPATRGGRAAGGDV